jgi:outer membrane lipoprotein-sorting protein
MSARPARLVLAFAAGFLSAASWAAPSDPAELEALLARFDKVQGSIRSLSAEFVERTESPLLKDAIVSEGRFYLTKPESVAWEYTAPEPMRFVLANREYVGVFPERKRAERRDLRRWSERIFRFFGVGQGSDELRKFYDIALAEPGSDMPGTALFLLEPKKRRVKKNVEEVRLWVDAGSMLPARMDFRGKDGNVRSIRFRNVRLNPDLSASLYRVEIPDGFAVSEGFSAFGGSTRSH